MPTDVHQSLAPNVPDFAHVMIVGPIQDARPFVKDLNHVVSTEPSSLDRLDYCAPALGTPHPTRAGFYFVGDSDHATEEIGDTLTFNRRWANIPSTRIDFGGTFAYSFPGLPNGTTGSAKAIIGYTPADGTKAVIPSPVIHATAHGFTAGQLVRYVINNTGGTVSPQVVGGVQLVLSVVDDDHFVLQQILQFIGPDGSFNVGTFSSGTITAFAVARGPTLLKSSVRSVFSYALPGVTPGITTPEDFRADPEFQAVITATSLVTDTLAGATTPTDTTYRALVASGGTICVESGISDYLSPILQRETRLVVAL